MLSVSKSMFAVLELNNVKTKMTERDVSRVYPLKSLLLLEGALECEVRLEGLLYDNMTGAVSLLNTNSNVPQSKNDQTICRIIFNGKGQSSQSSGDENGDGGDQDG